MFTFWDTCQFLALLWLSIVHYYFWPSYWSTTGYVFWLQTPAFSIQCCLAEDNLLGFPANATLKVLFTWVSQGSVQMMLLQMIPRKNVILCSSRTALAWDKVVLYQHSWHPKGRFLTEWLLRKRIFLQDPTKEKVTIGRDQPKILVASLQKSKPSSHPREWQMPSCHIYWWRRI